MQFFRGDDGRLTELPSRHIDTGMGLERVTSVLQDMRSNYDTDIFGPLLAAVHDLVGGEPYQGKVGADDVGMRDTAYRIVVDHARTLTMAVADGATPSSEGRGYVLRRILRRAVRYGRSKLDAPPGFFSKLVPKVVESLSPGFPDLTKAAGERVQGILQDEEVAFDRTVDRGMQFFDGLKADLEKEGAKVVPGDQAFLLYDSHGFPLDLTEQMALESGLSVDIAGFELGLDLDGEAGFQVQMAKQVWLQSAGIRFFAEGQWHGASGKNATMKQVSRQHYMSSDELGDFSCVNISWSVATLNQRVLIHTSFKIYLESCMVILVQEVPQGVQGTNASKAVMPKDGHQLEEGAHPPILSFPSFGVEELENLGFLTWKGVFAKAIYGKGVSQHLAGLSSNGPVVLFNQASDTLVVSPLDNFKSAVHTFSADANAWETGVSSEIQSLPTGFYHRTLIMAGVGITQAMDEYGRTMRKMYSTKRPQQRKDPVALQQQDLLKAVRIWQLDDWWYPGHPAVWVYCVENWTLIPPAFNKSLAELSAALGKPWLLYVPFFCPSNVYMKHFKFLEGSHGATAFTVPEPDDALAFYRVLFDYGMANGMSGFEHDFLNFNFLAVPHFRQTFGASARWLQAMDQAATERALPVQFCMALPSDLMQSLEFSSTTNYRASGDYASSDNFDIGASSLLGYALQLRPSKDNLWTHRPERAAASGKPWGPHQNPGSNCELNLLIATLSTGPVGIADQAGDSNATLLLRSIRSDGLILQPDKPATSIDASFKVALEAPGRQLQGHIWSTYAEVDVIPLRLPWHYVLSIDVKVRWQLQVDYFFPPLAMTGGARGWVARRWHAAHRPTACLDGQLAVRSGCLLGPSAVAEADLPRILNDRPVMVANDTHQFDLLQLSPVLENGWVLLGELGKYVSVSRKRFPRMTATPEGISVEVMGGKNEEIQIVALQPEKFSAAMEQQKERSRAALREQQAQEQGLRPLQLVAEQTAWLSDEKIPVTDDLKKYTWNIRPSARVEAIFTEQGFVNSSSEIEDQSASVGIVLNTTPFYAEAGGQVGDLGLLTNEDGEELMKVKVVQVFAGYVLHVGPMPLNLAVGDEVFCEVDYEHRSKVAPNHTMTHVLNWALREVLGDGLDQRGSLVTADRLRFDFSYEASNGVSVADLEKVETLVQKTVDAGLPVTSKEVALADAQAISGLRAMAGEAYPDPVRVVTVGSPIEEVLQTPGAEKWMSQSVEFCGGTHIATTSEAKHFVLLEEKGIAKGVRRIFAATGAVAETALEEAQCMEKRMKALETSSVEEDALMALQKDLDSLVLPAVPKAQLRDRLGELRKQLKKKQKKKKGKVSKEEQAAALTELKEAVAEAKSLGNNFCVKTFQGAGVDGKSLREAAQGGEFDIAVMVLNQPSPKALECLAAVPEALQAEKAAGKWVQAALATVGGKGGGQPAFAQGAAKGVQEEALQVAAEAARNF
eukprot:s16_g56.t2